MSFEIFATSPPARLPTPLRLRKFEDRTTVLVYRVPKNFIYNVNAAKGHYGVPEGVEIWFGKCATIAPQVRGFGTIFMKM